VRNKPHARRARPGVQFHSEIKLHSRTTTSPPLARINQRAWIDEEQKIEQAGDPSTLGSIGIGSNGLAGSSKYA
jgi:hypothetical protein